MTRAQYAAQRLFNELKRRGHLVTLRSPNVLPGSLPQPNPPRVEGLTLSGPHLAGYTSLNLVGTSLVGRFVAGDTLTIGSQILAVSDTATAVNNAVTVTTSVALGADAASGTVVTPGFGSDRRIYVRMDHLGGRLQEGQDLVESRGYTMTLANWQLGPMPTLRDQMILADGAPRKIISILPKLIDGHVAAYQLQLRW